MKKFIFFLALMSMASFFAFAQTYNITVSAIPPEGGIVSGGGEYEYGAIATVEAIPNSGYTFVYWYLNGILVPSIDPIYTFTVTHDCILDAFFTDEGSGCFHTVTVLADPAEGGEVFGSGIYECGTSVTLEAIAAPDYVFIYWSWNGVMVSNAPMYTILVSEDRTFTAHFAGENNNLYDIIVLANPEEGGEVSGGGSYPYGTQITITAPEPYSSYENQYNFVNWTKDGDVVSTHWNYTFTVTESAVYVANFERWLFNVVALPNPPDACHVQGSGLYLLGSPALVWAIYSCDDGEQPYEFVNWVENGIEVSTFNFYSFTVTGDRTLIANYEIYELKTIPTPPDGGTVQGSGNYPPGIEVTLTAIANDGYEFVGWSKNRTVVSTENPYTFITALHDEELVANFGVLGIETIDSYSVNIYPNPTTGELIISGELKIEKIDILDITGKVVSSHQITTSLNHQINISHLSAGIYFVKINTEAGEIVRKVVKE